MIEGEAILGRSWPHPGAKRWMVSRSLVSRLQLVAISLAYAFCLHFAHARYLYDAWAYFGFDFSPMNGLEISMAMGMVVIGSALLPLILKRPSSLIILVLFVVVYVPTIVFTLGLPGDVISKYGMSLTMLTVAFALASFTTRLSCRPCSEVKLPGKRFELAMVVLWLIVAVLLVSQYHSIMRFVGLADTYTQRAAGASQSTLMGYARTYFGIIISPSLIALGLVKSRKYLITLGIMGCLIMYMISAQKTSLALPVVLCGLYWVVNSRYTFIRSSSFAIGVPTVAVVLALWLNSFGGFFNSLPANLFIFRTLGLPGLAHTLYLDLFSSQGFTYWSHIRGINLLVAPPPVYLADPSWPNLGTMIGDRVYGTLNLNYNAHLYAWDGLAAAGSVGVLVIGVVTAAWLRVFDLVSRSVDHRFVLLVTLPIAVTISNGGLFTVLLSFGGLFWLAIFWLGNVCKRLTRMCSPQ